MREIATKKKPVFVQANSNSGQGHVLHYITNFCVVFRLSTLYFWLAGKTETKQVVNRMSKWVEGGGSWKGHESGQAVFIFLAASPLVLGRFAREFRGYAAPAPGSTKPPCYAGYFFFVPADKKSVHWLLFKTPLQRPLRFDFIAQQHFWRKYFFHGVPNQVGIPGLTNTKIPRGWGV